MFQLDIVCLELCRGGKPVSLRVMKPEATSCNVMSCHILGQLVSRPKTGFLAM